MGTEIPVWIGGLQKWVTGVTKQTTCEDVVKAVLYSNDDMKGHRSRSKRDFKDYTIVERWHSVERPLDSKSRLLKVWNTWGLEQCNVRFLLKRVHGSPPKDAKSHHRQRRQGKTGVTKSAKTWHPRKLRSESEEDYLDEDDFPATPEQLKNLIASQEETLMSQVRRLQEKDEEIEYYENQIHLQRMQQIGVNYVQDTYLAESSEGDSSSSGGSHAIAAQSSEETCDILDHCIELYEKVLELCDKVRQEEDSVKELTSKLKQSMTLRETEQNSTKVDDNSSGVTYDDQPERLEEMLSRTKRDIDRLLRVNETQQKTINQNDQTLTECTKLIEEKYSYLQHLRTDLDQLDRDNNKLQEEFSLLQSVAVSVEASTSACCEANESGDSNSDTGLSSLHSSSDDGVCVLDTLV